MSISILVFFVSWILVGLFVTVAEKKNLKDIPTSRGLHTVPTPRGGGLVITILFTLCIAIHSLRLESNLWLGTLLGSILVAGIGFLDDIKGISSKVRILVHLVAACAFLICLLINTNLELPPLLIVLLMLVSLFLIVWSINLYNFMDGINGLASGQAVYVSIAAIVVLSINQAPTHADLFLNLAIITLGFLSWNLTPARVFLGDIGSGYLGYILVCLALVISLIEGINIFNFIMAMNIFWIDTSYTLIIRAIDKKRLTEAHCTHAYQNLTKKLASHNKTLVAYMSYNLLWNLPCIYLFNIYKDFRYLIFILSIIPILFACVYFRAGKEPR